MKQLVATMWRNPERFIHGLREPGTNKLKRGKTYFGPSCAFIPEEEQ